MPGLGRELVRSLAGTNVTPRLVGNHPPAWRLGPLTVIVRKRADLHYARQLVGWCRPRARDIVDAATRAVGRLQARSQAPDVLLPRLAAAYAAVVARRRGRPGDRAPLVEVRDELGYPRAQFAWDLARLRFERRLVVDGRRIDLGVATGHAAERPSQVVWIEHDGGGGGAYYETFRLITQEARA